MTHATLPTLNETRLPRWLRAAAALGILWNGYGAVQFAGSVTATAETLVAAGLTPAQAEAMTSYPGWMTAAFAIGVVGGLAGSVLLALGRRAAVPAFAASLAAYIALYVGDIVHGVFAAMGAPQVIVLTVVVAIALGLFAIARRAGLRRQLI